MDTTIEKTIFFTPGVRQILISVGKYTNDKILVQQCITVALNFTLDADTLSGESVLFYKDEDPIFAASLQWVTSQNGILRITSHQDILDYEEITQKLNDCIAETF